MSCVCVEFVGVCVRCGIQCMHLCVGHGYGHSILSTKLTHCLGCFSRSSERLFFFLFAFATGGRKEGVKEGDQRSWHSVSSMCALWMRRVHCVARQWLDGGPLGLPKTLHFCLCVLEFVCNDRKKHHKSHTSLPSHKDFKHRATFSSEIAVP